MSLINKILETMDVIKQLKTNGVATLKYFTLEGGHVKHKVFTMKRTYDLYLN
jgi:hypothetical protein